MCTRKPCLEKEAANKAKNNIEPSTVPLQKNNFKGAGLVRPSFNKKKRQFI